jgi:hypothetical protein
MLHLSNLYDFEALLQKHGTPATPQPNFQDGLRFLKKENVLFDLEHAVTFGAEERARGNE